MSARAAAALRTTKNSTQITEGAMKSKEAFAVAVVAVVILLSLCRIGAAAYRYTLWEIDRRVPPPTTTTPDQPLLPEEKETTPPADDDLPLCDTNCQHNQVIQI